MGEKKIRAGTRLLFNPLPSNFPTEVLEKIQGVLEKVSGVNDAYLTDCCLPNETASRWILVIGIEPGVPKSLIANRAMDLLDEIYIGDQGIDVLPFEVGSIPPAVMQTGKKLS